MLLENKVAIVTGAASGIGKEIATMFAREGARVATADLNQKGADAMAAELGGAKQAIAVARFIPNDILDNFQGCAWPVAAVPAKEQMPPSDPIDISARLRRMWKA